MSGSWLLFSLLPFTSARSRGKTLSLMVCHGGIATEVMSNPGDRPHYLRGICEGGKIRLSGTQQSHAIFGLSRANCLIRLGPDGEIKVGDAVSGFAI